MRKSDLGMRMTPKQYFAFQDRSSPLLFCEAEREHEVIPLCREDRHAIGWVVRPPYIPELPPEREKDHTALIIGVVAVVGLVVLGLAYLSKRG